MTSNEKLIIALGMFYLIPFLPLAIASYDVLVGGHNWIMWTGLITYVLVMFWFIYTGG